MHHKPLTPAAMTKKTKRIRPILSSYQELKKQRDSFAIMWVVALEARDKWLKEYQTQELITKDLLERLTIERKNHRNTWRISMYYMSAMLILVFAPIIIKAIYGV